MRAVARSLDILELLARHPAPLPAPVIGRMCDIPRSTTYELLASLEGRGMARVDDEGRWSAGAKLDGIYGAPPTLQEAVAVLEAFERGSERLEAAEIATRSGVAPSRVARLLLVLESESLLTHDGGTLALGARLALFASRFQPLERLRRAARPVLLELRSGCGETANLLVADREMAVYVDQVERSTTRTQNGWTGRGVPLAGTACGRALASGAGVHVVSDAVEPGVTAVACAVGGPSAYPAVISLIGPSHRMLGGQLDAIRQRVAEGGRTVTERFAALSQAAI